MRPAAGGFARIARTLLAGRPPRFNDWLHYAGEALLRHASDPPDRIGRNVLSHSHFRPAWCRRQVGTQAALRQDSHVMPQSMRATVVIALVLLFACPLPGSLRPGLGPVRAEAAQNDIDTLLAPIALYPDALLAQILMCAADPGSV